MKVLTINCTYDKSSTGTIIMDIANSLDDIDFYFCYETGPKSGGRNYRVTMPIIQRFYYIMARVTGLKHSTGFIPTIFLLRRIRIINPDIVHIHCPYINTIHIPFLINELKRRNVRTIITNHAEFYYTGNCQYSFDCMRFQTGCGKCSYVFDPYRKYLFDRTRYEWLKMKNAFSNFSNLCMVGVSPWVYERLCLSPISSALNKAVILNGIDTGVFNCIPKTQIKYKDYILHVTAHFSVSADDLKGGYYLVKIAERLPDRLFLVIGNNTVSKDVMLPDNVVLLGSIENRVELAEYYRNARLLVVTSRRETFGMVCAESLCCGTPVVGFRSGGTESISIRDFSEFCNYGDIEELIGLIKKWEYRKKELINCSQISIQKYSREVMANEYRYLYRKMIDCSDNG